jgi:arabinoxylan arabinofuranohydrolase
MASFKFAVLAQLVTFVLGANPIVTGQGLADPHIKYWPQVNAFYAYSTHDLSPNNTGFDMTDWRVWMSPDLVLWVLADTLLPQNTPSPKGAWNQCWATDAAYRNSMYYFYLSIGGDQVAVMTSPNPAGPWNNVLGVPLLNSSLGNSLGTTLRDPCVFKDDDGEFYIIAGVFKYFIAKLNPDMVSLAEYPREVIVNYPLGPYGNSTDDKPFIHKFNGVYYLSWGCFYGTSTSVYGPYNVDYNYNSFVLTDNIEPAFRTNNTGGAWYSHEDYQDRHGGFWTFGNQWFWAGNDRSHSGGVNPGVFRDTVLAYVSYFDNGTIVPVTINGQGVGSYGASFGKIEAENYMSLSFDARKSHTPDGLIFGVSSLSPTSVIRYPHVFGLQSFSDNIQLIFYYSNSESTTTSVFARIGSETGSILAVCDMKNTENEITESHCSVDSKLVKSNPEFELVLTFHSSTTNGLFLDAFQFVDLLLQ